MTQNDTQSLSTLSICVSRLKMSTKYLFYHVQPLARAVEKTVQHITTSNATKILVCKNIDRRNVRFASPAACRVALTLPSKL